jgi:GNAT superfamily N-acetyltransferase
LLAKRLVYYRLFKSPQLRIFIVFKLRNATSEDIPLILKYIKELASWENLEHEVIADEGVLKDSLFKEPVSTYAIIAEDDDIAVGFCIYFYNFSTFLGRRGIYVEDLYIVPQARGRGYGRLVLAHLAKKAIDEGCGRLEWWVLDANTSAVDFYRKIEARPMHEWTVQRLEGPTLKKLAEIKPQPVDKR